jgi:ribosomal protein L29
MKFKALKEKRTDELQRLLIDYSQKLRELNFKEANKQLKNVRELREVKKNLAHIKTLLKERKEL